ncbi:thioesterase family protein [Sneathiella chinensis]|uniref:Thioesterase n=1 Tax=Sneathiella chinensis TaxID=349750 RepID=A0ABQ5U195_9PROT|nr:thioesterase family protein [Sneathiella chinensis]GLQ05488.1 hypothetical protein GCM10007924_07090 [Sneathiella chinensis]
MTVMNTKLIPGYRGAVESWERDQMQHMNVQFYMSKASAAFSHLQNALGLSPARIREDRKALRYRTLRIQYRAEMHVGGLMHGFSGIRAVDGDTITGFTHLFNSKSGALSGVYEFTADYQDLDTGETHALPADVRQAATDLIDDHADQYKPAPMKTVILPARNFDHMFETNRSAVDEWECDAYGTMDWRQIVGRFSDAAGHIMGHVGMTREMQKARNLGSAALDYYTEFHGPIKSATSIVLKSALVDRMPKNFVFGHNLMNNDTGEILCTTTVLGCYFDMALRKAVPLPEEYMAVPEENLLVNQL